MQESPMSLLKKVIDGELERVDIPLMSINSLEGLVRGISELDEDYDLSEALDTNGWEIDWWYKVKLSS